MATGTLLTVAPTGAETDKSDAPALPVSLDELVATAVACQAAGAAVIHIHVRDAAARPTLDPGLLREAVAAVRRSTDLVVQLSTGGAGTHGEAARVRGLDADPGAPSPTRGPGNLRAPVFPHRRGVLARPHPRERRPPDRARV